MLCVHWYLCALDGHESPLIQQNQPKSKSNSIHGKQMHKLRNTTCEERRKKKEKEKEKESYPVVKKEERKKAYLDVKKEERKKKERRPA